MARTAASSAVLAALRAKLLAEANMPDMEVAAFSAGSSLAWGAGRGRGRG